MATAHVNVNVNDTHNNNNNPNSSKASCTSSKQSLFNYETLDPDLPNFTSTKRLSPSWRTIYVLFFMIFSFAFFVCPICIMCGKDSELSHFCLLIGSFSYGVCACMEWWHYHRGCCSYSNLNSITKTNIDRSIKATCNRGKVGCLHFISLLVAACLFGLCAVLYVSGLSLYSKPKYRDNRELNTDVHVVFAVALVVLAITQIVKFERIANPTKQYVMANDFANFFVEWFFLSGIFIYSLGAISYVVHKEGDLFMKCDNIYVYFSICGGLLFMLSGVSQVIRFFCSDNSDLNNSEEDSKYSI